MTLNQSGHPSALFRTSENVSSLEDRTDSPEVTASREIGKLYEPFDLGASSLLREAFNRVYAEI
jgi:hypothetical protein